MKTIFQGKILTIPNLLTFSRILMIPWFLWTYLVKENSFATALILLLSILTDNIDGPIARRWHMESNLGKALDPLADKLTQFCMLVCLQSRFPHMLLVIGMMCVKELAATVTSLAVIKKTNEVFSSEWHGKRATDLLDAVLVLHLLFPGMPGALSYGLILLCTGMILLSGVLYVRRNMRAIRAADDSPEPEENRP